MSTNNPSKMNIEVACDELLSQPLTIYQMHLAERVIAELNYYIDLVRSNTEALNSAG